jgi:hypothetical protein
MGLEDVTRGARGSALVARRRVGWAVGAGAASCAVLGMALAQAQPPALPSYLSVESIRTEAPTSDTKDLGSTSETETPETDIVASTTSETDTVDLGTVSESAAEKAPDSRVTAIGDSVMIGATGELEQYR